MVRFKRGGYRLSFNAIQILALDAGRHKHLEARDPRAYPF